MSSRNINMQVFVKKAIVFLFIIFPLVASAKGQLSVQAIDVAGDSISKGFNAGSAFPCSNGDQENYNWLTSDTHGSAFCSAGNEGVYSFLERLECDAGTNIFAPPTNHAASGATLVRDLVNQANSVRTYLSGQAGQRLAVVFLGHNDSCSGTQTKVNASCSSTDLDPANYCKTTPAAFERELRKGLDVLITIGNTRVGVSAPVRVSQLCNFGSKANCQVGGTCQFLWGSVSICQSLTRNCTSDRIIDTYTTMKGYRDTLASVTAEYDGIPIGGTSRILMIGGQIVGGATKAVGTTVGYSDAAWMYKFNADQLSCCDCFHPSAIGQDTLGRLAKTGLTCSRVNPCCRETGDPLVDGKCEVLERRNRHHRGLL